MKYIKIIKAVFSSLLLLFIVLGCTPSSAVHRYTIRHSEVKLPDASSRYNKDTSMVPSGTYQNPELQITEEDNESEPAGLGMTALDNAVPGKIAKSNLGVGANFANIIESMKMVMVKYDETPYHFGGNTLDGIDCSAFTSSVYNQSFNLSIPRSAREQFTVGEVIRSRDELKFGDLIFFDTRRRVKPGHVAIYLGDNKFVHSSSKHGVIVSSLDDAYYTKRYMGGRRVLDLEAALAEQE